MKLAVLDLSYWPPEYMSGQPRFGEVLADWVARGVPQAEISVIDLVEGDPYPDLHDHDGYVISGSDKGVYDAAPWMGWLRRFLSRARQAETPLFGVCFGHQIMADVFGGKAEKVGAPVAGVREFDLGGARHPAHVWHQDQVTRPPPGARVFAHADYCPVAALEYDFPAMSVQFHPEYPAAYMAGFLRRSDGAVLPRAQSETVLAELDASPVRADLFAAEMGAFFRRHIPGRPGPV